MIVRVFSIYLLISMLLFACSDEVNQGTQDVKPQQDVSIDTGFVCRNKADCPSGKDCINGKCIDVEEDAGFDAGMDIGDIGDGGKYCTKDEECPQNHKCNTSNNTCEEIKEPKVCLSEKEMDFGYVQYGQSKEKCVVLTNCGNVELLVTGVEFAKDTSSAYKFKAGQENRKTLQPNSSDYLDICVVVAPNSEEAPQGAVDILSNAYPPRVTIPLKSQYKGSADLVFIDEKNRKLWPDGGTSTFKVDFGLVGPGNTKSLKFRITNATDGDKPLLIKSLDRFATQFSGRFFDISNDTKELTPPIIVGPSQIIGLEIIYAPTQRSPKDQGNLLVETNDFDIDNNGTSDNGKLLIECSGVAEFPPDISVDPLSLNFGDVQKGVKNPPKKKFLIINTADTLAGQTLKITAEIGNSTETSFTFSPTSHDIPPGEGREIEVAFAPTALDIRSNTIKISSNAPDMANPGKFKNFVVALQGRGLDPQFSVNPSDSVMDFGEVEINKFVEKTITISNLTSPNLGDLIVYEPELATSSSPYSVSSSKPFVNGQILLTPGQQILLTVKYAPTTTGSNSNVLKLRSNDEDLPLKEISLFGICVNYNGDPIAVAKIIGATDPKKGYFEPNTTVTIDGSESQDPDLNPAMRKIEEYKWTLIAKPTGSNVTLSNTNQVTTTIKPDKIGIYKIGLEVRDNENIWSPQDVVQVIGVGKDILKISTSRNVGLKGYNSSIFGCVACSCSGGLCEHQDQRYELSSLIVDESTYQNLIGYFCDFIKDDPNNKKDTCIWQTLGEVVNYTYCNGLFIAPDYILNPLVFEYNSAPIDENTHEFIYQLEYAEDSICSGTSSLTVKTDFSVNGSIVKTTNTTLNTKGEKKNIARIKRQFGKFEVTVLP